MTNEEIRLNQYCKNCRNYNNGCGWLCRGMICNEADAYEMALDTKDQQFKEYLEKKIEKYDSANYLVYAEHIHICRTIINELFGEE